METIKIKPLSANQAWKGRRYPTPAYNQYKQDIHYLLPPSVFIPTGKLKVKYLFGVSSKAFDYDNGIKQFQDCLSKKYGFNDNRIYRAIIDKIDVSKGEEFISFSIEAL